ncbi:autism susceptibility gene 2 protein homolog isoform X2 [Lepisosteus oculatus]|uniref:autism susceptibility gene 2 protein homolog isoform X2 n=1 Tax=Lepisosteus oculatus TaxID=7918 RepID=UPI00371A6421
MDGPGRSAGYRQSRRSRSQRDRERRRRRSDLAEQQRASSGSSGSEREAAGGEAGGGGASSRHRPPRRRKRESVSCEEDIIDGFAIASFVSLEALEDCSLKPPERVALWERRGSKRKRAEEEGPRSDPEDGDPLPPRPPAAFSRHEGAPDRRASKRRRKREGPGSLFLETGYICDTESDSGDRVSDDMDRMFTVTTRKVPETAVGPVNGRPCDSCGPARLSVTPRVSGLQRSQERSQDPLPPPRDALLLLPPGPAAPRHSPSPAPVLPSQHPRLGPSPAPQPAQPQLNGDGRPPSHGPSPPQPRNKTPLSFGPAPQTVYSSGLGLSTVRSSTPVKRPSSNPHSQSHRSSTPSSTGMAISLGGAGAPPSSSHSFGGALRPPSHPGSGGAGLFTPSPGLPPPPPLLQVSSHHHSTVPANTAAFTDHDLLRQELNSRFLSHSAEPVGVGGGGGAGGGRGGAGGGSASGAAPGSGAGASPAQPAIPPLAFQFHQHNHQHQHTHTHQHFTPFLTSPAAAPPLFDKFPGKMEGLYRHSFYPNYPHSVPGIQPVLPGPFSSLQGAFQPKATNPEMAARLGAVPHALQPKDPRLTDHFRTSLRVNNKPGKWCAMHVRVAWMILRHQEKVKMMQGDPHKLDFRTDLLARMPGASSLPTSHQLARPASLFSAAGAVHPSSSPFVPPSGPHSSFLAPATHLDPFGRSQAFTPLGALGNGAFGGLGSPTLGAGSVFGHKDSPGGVTGGFGSPHDTWNRLHRTPPSFPTAPAWSKGSESERDRDAPLIKDEKDRDSAAYGRHPVRMSPAHKPAPASHSNGHGSHGPGGGPDSDAAPRARSREPSRDRDHERERERTRDRERDSRQAPAAPRSSSLAPERPRSSSSASSCAPTPAGESSRPSHTPPARPEEAAARSSRENGCAPNPPPADRKPSTPDLLLPPQLKKTPDGAPPASHVKVKEERKEEPEPVPISLPPPPPPHAFERPSSRPHPSALHPPLAPGPPLGPPAFPALGSLSLLERTRMLDYLGGPVPVLAGERFPPHHHHHPAAPPPASAPFGWDWRELSQQQQRREALALRPDPHLSRLLAAQHHHHHHHHAQRFYESSAAASSAGGAPGRADDFGLLAHERPGAGGLLDEEERAHILREDFERARFYAGVHSHPGPPHPGQHPVAAAALEQLAHPGLLAPHHGPPPPPGALYSRLGPALHTHAHHPNSLLTKTPPGLVGPLGAGPPPPLIPTVAPSRASASPRSSRMGGPPVELAMYGAHKDRDSR